MDARIPDGLTAIRQGWTLKDLLDAHDLLDEADAAHARQQAAERARQQAGAAP